MLRSLIFGDFMDTDSLPEDRKYDEIKDISAMYPVVEQCLQDYNATHKNKMSLVIFRYIQFFQVSFIYKFLRVLKNKTHTRIYSSL